MKTKPLKKAIDANTRAIVRALEDIPVRKILTVKRTMEEAFNKWMDDFINNPQAYEKIADAALRHVRERMDTGFNSYGHDCAAILRAYMGEKP